MNAVFYVSFLSGQILELVWPLPNYLEECCDLLACGGGPSVFLHDKSERKQKKLSKPPTTTTQGQKSKRKIL